MSLWPEVCPVWEGGIRPHRRPSSHSASQPAVNLATSSLSEKKHSLADSVNQNSRLHPEIGHRTLWARKGTQWRTANRVYPLLLLLGFIVIVIILIQSAWFSLFYCFIYMCFELIHINIFLFVYTFYYTYIYKYIYISILIFMYSYSIDLFQINLHSYTHIWFSESIRLL